MDDMVISFDSNGVVEAMHNDKFNLSFLGQREINRASDIKHDIHTDTWGIYLNDGNGAFTVSAPALQGFNDYEEARQFEVKWLNKCRMDGIAGNSAEALDLLAVEMRGTWSYRDPAL